MATKISDLPAAGEANATDQLEANQAGTSRRVTVAQLNTYIWNQVPAQFPFVAGSAAAPSIIPAGDANTGIWSPAADNLAIATAGAERLRVDSTGQVGIGSSAPARQVHAVVSTSSTNAVQQVLRLDTQCTGTPAAGIGAGLEFAAETTNNNTEVGVVLEAVTTDVTATSEDFDLVIKTMAAGAAASQRAKINVDGLSVTGAIVASGNVTAYSDARLKERVETIAGALALVERLRGVRYVRSDTGEAGVGVIAQELREVVPEAVASHGEYLSVAYGNLVGVLIEAVKDLAGRVAALEAGR